MVFLRSCRIFAVAEDRAGCLSGGPIGALTLPCSVFAVPMLGHRSVADWGPYQANDERRSSEQRPLLLTLTRSLCGSLLHLRGSWETTITMAYLNGIASKITGSGSSSLMCYRYPLPAKKTSRLSSLSFCSTLTLYRIIMLTDITFLFLYYIFKAVFMPKSIEKLIYIKK